MICNLLGLYLSGIFDNISTLPLACPPRLDEMAGVLLSIFF